MKTSRILLALLILAGITAMLPSAKAEANSRVYVGVDLGGLVAAFDRPRLRVWHPLRIRTTGALRAAMAHMASGATASLSTAAVASPSTATGPWSVPSLALPLAPPGPRQGWLSPLIPTSRSKMRGRRK